MVFDYILTEKQNDDLIRKIAIKTADFTNEKIELHKDLKRLEQDNRLLSGNFTAASTEIRQLKENLAEVELRNQRLRVLNSREDIWCSCNREAFGEMIACDNPNCAIKWYHLECVYLTEAPEGEWFCGECT